MLKIHEATTPLGDLSPVYLQLSDDELEIVSEGVARRVPSGALTAVLSRFGAPFDEAAPIVEIGTLSLAEDESIRHVRHLAGYDVIARDYLVHHRGGEEARCALAATVSAALIHLARAAESRDA